jgi:TonB family protein
MMLVLLSAAVRILLIGAAAWLVLRIVRTRNPHAEALVWRMIVLAGLALPGLLYWRLAPSFESSFGLPLVVTAVERPAGAAAVTAGFDPTLSWGLAAPIYIAVASLFLGRLGLGLLAMWRMSRAARPLPMPDDIRMSEQIQSPATFGAVILLPADASSWPVERLDPVLAHERAHVRSRDGYWSWLAQLHIAVFWFNPLAWWLHRRLEALAETTSDDAVVAARHDPIAYAELLLNFARQPNSRSVAMSVADSNVSQRIERLLANTPPASALPRLVRWTTVVALIPAVVLAASTTQAETPAASSPAAASAVAKPATSGAASVRLTSVADPNVYYPPVAEAENVEGYVIVEVDLDKLGQLVDARVLKAEPADPRYGFADAALEVARNNRYANSTQEVASMKFMVKFALQN